MLNKTRNIVRIIKEVCCEQGIECNSFSYDWIFELKRDMRKNYIFGYQFGINSSTSVNICADKSATSEIFTHNNIPNVKHTLFMSPNDIKYVGESGNWSRLINLLSTHGSLICKTNEGSGGNNVYKVTNQFELEEATHKIFKTSRTMAVSPYEDIENEYRVVVLNGDARLIFSKNIQYIVGNGYSTVRQLVAKYILENVDAQIPTFTPEQLVEVLPEGFIMKLHWKHNLGQGAIPVIVEDRALYARLSEFATHAAKSLGINFASVDVISVQGMLKILEVNSGVMMEHFSQANEANYQMAKNIYKDAIVTMLV